MRHLAVLDMVLNSIINLVLEKLPVDPADPTQGRIYYNTTSNVIRFADGTRWSDFASSMSASDILAQIVTVDGASSGLDADLLDGLEAAAFALAGHTHTANQITDLAPVIDARIMAAFTNGAIDTSVDTITEFTQLIKDNEENIALIMSIKRHDELLPAGNTATVNHNLNTLHCLIQVIEEATGETVIADHRRTDPNNAVIRTDSPKDANAYRAVILA